MEMGRTATARRPRARRGRGRRPRRVRARRRQAGRGPHPGRPTRSTRLGDRGRDRRRQPAARRPARLDPAQAPAPDDPPGALRPRRSLRAAGLGSARAGAVEERREGALLLGGRVVLHTEGVVDEPLEARPDLVRQLRVRGQLRGRSPRPTRAPPDSPVLPSATVFEYVLANDVERVAERRRSRRGRWPGRSRRRGRPRGRAPRRPDGDEVAVGRSGVVARRRVVAQHQRGDPCREHDDHRRRVRRGRAGPAASEQRVREAPDAP